MSNPEVSGAVAKPGRRRGKTGSPQQAWLPTAEERIVLLDSSKRLQQAADEVGRSVSTVWRHRRRLGVVRTPHVRREWTTEEQSLLFDCSLSAEEVASQIDRSAAVVADRRRALGVKGKKAGRRPRPWTEDETAVVLDTSKSAAEVSAEIGRGADAVNRRRRELGVAFGWRRGEQPLAHRDPWSPEEDAILLASSLPVRETASQIGRTLEAAKRRRRCLRTHGPADEKHGG